MATPYDKITCITCKRAPDTSKGQVDVFYPDRTENIHLLRLLPENIRCRYGDSDAERKQVTRKGNDNAV